ncbi:MAG TPA: 4'-phosphopantetheinyl transferase superfamily protein [Methylomirabilota bacterium]|nr:4'-phosphopantetheinyl transferase superfamily protein [Methylomirabilota bacterium]
MLSQAPPEADAFAWPDASPPFTLAAGDVHVWRAALDEVADADVARLALTLAADERARASRLVHAPDRRRFVVGRAALRMVLAHYLGGTPAAVAFGRTPAGKPVLADALGATLRFSASHRAGVALCALVAGRDVGVDVERIVRGPVEDLVADRILAAGELVTLRALPPAERERAFFAVWTRKEAYAKARGLGLALPFDRFTVSADPDAPALLDAEDDDPRRWSLRDLRAGEGYAAALVVEGPIERLTRCQWTVALSAG